MKKLIYLLFAIAPVFTFGQSCDKTSCGPEGTKKGEAAAISSLRADLQTAISKMSQSALAFDKAVLEMEIVKGTTDDESLLYISQAASAVRNELVARIEASKVLSSLREYRTSPVSTKQQMMAGLKKEVQLLVDQADKL